MKLETPTWFDLVHASADRSYLLRRFSARGYSPPARAHLVAAAMSQGIGQAAFHYHSLNDTGFAYSPGRFWPASTVKLMAAVGALLTLRRHGLDGDTRLRFSDSYGRFSGNAAMLIRQALVRGTNVEYDRLLLVAGLDDLNSGLDRQRYGLPLMVIQRPYGGAKDLGLSPAIEYVHKGRRGTIPGRRSRLRFQRCPYPSNCTTLFELQEVLRRVALHRELSSAQRFPLTDRDAARLANALLKASGRLERPALWVLGPGARVYNRWGRFPGNDMLDNALIVSGKERYLLALSVAYPSPRATDLQVARLLGRLARETLRALRLDAARKGPPLQADSGDPLSVEIACQDEAVKGWACLMKVSGKSIDELLGWVGQKRLLFVQRGPSLFEARHVFAGSKKQVVALLGRARGRDAAFRSISFSPAQKGSRVDLR